MKKKLIKYIMGLLITSFSLMVVYISAYYYRYYHESEVVESANIELKELLSNIPIEVVTNKPIVPNDKTELLEIDGISEDLVAWIDIPCCEISLPVFTNEVENYYLRTDRNGKYSLRGEIYTNDYTYDDNCLVYGHNFLDNTMFGNLSSSYIGMKLSLTDIDTMCYNEYVVEDMKIVSEKNFWETIDEYDTKLILVTCSGSNDRLIVVCNKGIDK